MARFGPHFRALAARREALLRQADAQRAEVSDLVASIRGEFASVESSLGLLRRVLRRPLVVGLCLVGTVLVIARPRQALTWTGYALTAYTLWRRLRAALASASTS